MFTPSPGPSGHHSRNASPHLGHLAFSSNSRGRPSGLGRRASLGSDRSELPSKAMDLDFNRFSVERGKQSEEARTFALSDTLSVRLAATHPIEMQQAFQAADPTRDIFTGSVHVFNGQTSYSVVTSVQTCFVWKIDLSSPFHPPTCYMFPVPPPDSSSPYLAVPFSCLLPFGASREPGLILVSSSGEVRFWDSIGTGLAGAERFDTTQIALVEGESVNGIERVDPSVYIVRTNTRLHRLTLTARPGTGKFVVVATLFNDPQGNQASSWLSPFKILQQRSRVWDGGEVVAAVTPPHTKLRGKTREVIAHGGEERLVWVLTNRNLMKWIVNLEGGEQCELNQDVKETVVQAILDRVGGDRMSLDVELLDITINSSGDPTLLISHGPLNTQKKSLLEIDMTPARVYAVVRLRLSARSNSFEVTGDIEVLPYELATDLRRASSPRLALLPNSGLNDGLELAFSQFSDAFAFTSCEPPYQEQLHLKSVDDIILGFNVLEGADGHDVLLLTSGMVLVARPNIANIKRIKDDVHIGRANVLKSTIRQAMKYGIKPENPLKFQLPSIADGESLKTAVEQMSRAFLTSDPDVVPPNLSMGTQLGNRESALRVLVTFIGESGGLGKLSQSTREQLLADAEKVAATRGVWAYHNEQAQKLSSPSLLPQAVEAYMNRIGGVDHGDAIRTFFTFEVPTVGALVPEIVNIVKHDLSSSDALHPPTYTVIQANGLVQALFTTAFRYRSENRANYHITHPLVEPWTSEPSLLASLRRMFNITVQLRTQNSEQSSRTGDRIFGDATIQEELTLQLRELASCLFGAYKDRLDFLESRSQEGVGNERERNKVDEEFRALRPEVLGQLVQADSTDFAFKLAESCRDFHALSELSYHPSASKEISTSNRIRDYTDKYQQEFSSELYKWYIEQGKLKLLFDQEGEFEDNIESFFEKNPTPRISWIYDVGEQDYQRAASALLDAAEEETNRETRHLMLSIGKLTSMAEGPAATSQDKVQAFNNSLDFMAIHNTLLEQFNENFGDPADFALESRVKTIVSATCTVPSDRPALLDLFRRTLRQLLQGHALSDEDAVDLLSMKDNNGHPGDFVDALIIVSNSPYLSDERKATALRNVWRRIYLHDDWKHIRDSASKTDYELTAKLRNTQLYQTLASPAFPHNRIATPSEAVHVPTAEEIEMRWPGMAPNQVYELAQDFARESSLLANDGPSDEDFLHVRKLVNEDVGRVV